MSDPIPPSRHIDPSRIGLGEEIGRGDFGRALRAELDGNPVCVKALHIFENPSAFGLDLTSSDVVKALEELEKEASTLFQLVHPNVLSIHGVVLDSGCGRAKWLVTELANESLSSYVKKRVLSRWELWSILHGMASGLRFMHSRGVMHRDVKPENVFVFVDGETGAITAKLGDLGLGKLVQLASTRGIGSMFYSAPDVMLAAPYTAKIDVFSVGVSLCELIVRAFPVEGPALIPNPTQVYLTNRFDMVREALTRIRGGARAWTELADVITHCTVEAADERWDSTQLLQAVLDMQLSALHCPSCDGEYSASRVPQCLTACGHHMCSLCRAKPTSTRCAVCAEPIPRKRGAVVEDPHLVDTVIRAKSPWLSLPPLGPALELTFVLMGQTGTGKSTTGCKLVGYDPTLWYDADGSGKVSSEQRSPPEGETIPSRQLGFPFVAVGGGDPVTSTIQVYNKRERTARLAALRQATEGVDGAGVVGGGSGGSGGDVVVTPASLLDNLTVVDTPGFCDPGAKDAVTKTDAGICSAVCEAMQNRGGATALLFFINSLRADDELAKQLLVLHLYFGATVWDRVVFVVRSPTCAQREYSDMSAVLAVAKRRLEDEIGVALPSFRTRPVLLSLEDSCETVFGKVRWALHENGVDVGSKMAFTFTKATCRKCGACDDPRLVEALSRVRVTIPDARTAKCHGKLVKRSYDDGVGWRMASFVLAPGVLIGMLGVSVLAPIIRMGREDYLHGVKLLASTLVGNGFRTWYVCCSEPDCGRRAGTRGCLALSSSVQHKFEGPSYVGPLSQWTPSQCWVSGYFEFETDVPPL